MKRWTIPLLLLAAAAAHGQETLRFAHFFGDHMVVQRDRPVVVWGLAPAGSAVRVWLGGEAVSTTNVTADADGRWRTQLPAREATFEPQRLVAQCGDETVAIEDVLVGEVWLTSGQSNMAWGMGGDTEFSVEKVACDHPAIRYAGIKRRKKEPTADLDQPLRWMPLARGCDLGRVSGVSYWFAERLHRYLDVPVGIYGTAIGGTLAEEWTSRTALEELPALRPFLEARGSSDCYNGMIAPVRGFGFRGALFFQGENNSIGKWNVYRHSFPRMISDWRETLGDPELPFGIVSLFGFGPHGRDLDPSMAHVPPGLFWYAAIRDVHFRTHRAVPNTGLIVTTDVGDTANIHPHRKRAVGWRAARWALAEVYEQPIVHTGPLYREARVDGKKMILSFDLDPQVESRKRKKPDEVVWWLDYPISREGKEYRGFIIAGEDRVFHPARVRRGREKQTLEVSSDLVPNPVAVRFGWSGMPDANVIGHEHLPMHPFRTDDWPLLPDAPYGKDDEARKAWNEQVDARKTAAKREKWRRQLAEMGQALERLRREAERGVAEKDREAWRKTVAEIEERLSLLRTTLKE